MVIWEDYYEYFKIEKNLVRQGCEPRIMFQDSPTQKAIVLIHGLTDSPFSMEEIGKCFYNWGYNVYLPLLAGHGLKDPKYLKDVTVETWINNVNFTIQKAKAKSKIISIGGLSMGGTLSVLKMFESPNDITGGLFLFSAALDIGGIMGNLAEKLLRTPIIIPILAYLEDKYGKNLVGNNPYRYSRMDLDGAKELSKLIYKVDKYLKKIQKDDIKHPIFVAHSEYDRAADIKGVEALIDKSDITKTKFFRIEKVLNVAHPCVVLREDIKDENNCILKAKNPVFNEMMNAVYEFQNKYL